MRGAGRSVEPGVVRQRRDALRGEELGGLLDRLAREAVDDARIARVFGAQQLEELAARLVLGRDAVGDVGPVEAGDELPRVLQLEPLGDLGVGGAGGRGGEGDARDVRPPLVQLGEREVVGPEVVAPLGDAVRLVDGEQRDAAAFEQVRGGRNAESLGGEVEQVELAREEERLDHPAFVEVLRGVEEARADAERGERVDLILHERDQRGDDHSDARPDQGRDLVAERLPPAGGHEHDRVATRADVVDDRRLLAAEVVVAEHALQDVERRGRGVGEHGPDGRPVPRRETRRLENPDSPSRKPRLALSGVRCSRPGWRARRRGARRTRHRRRGAAPGSRPPPPGRRP